MAGKKNAERIANPRAALKIGTKKKVAERANHPAAAMVFAFRKDA